MVYTFDTQQIDLTADPPTCSPSSFDVDQFSIPGEYLNQTDRLGIIKHSSKFYRSRQQWSYHVNLTVPSSHPVAIQLDLENKAHL